MTEKKRFGSMGENVTNYSTEELVKCLAELEHSYVDAFADNCDRVTLSMLWQRIKAYRSELQRRQHSH